MSVAYAAKADANQKEIVQALKVSGARVLSLHRVGSGCPDLLVGWKGGLYLLEVKDRKRRKNLTVAQVKFHELWGSYVHVVCDRAEALAVLGITVLQ